MGKEQNNELGEWCCQRHVVKDEHENGEERPSERTGDEGESSAAMLSGRNAKVI